MDFNAEEYWSDKASKVWVVRLGDRRGNRETRIVRATEENGALATGRYFSSLKGRLSARARLATPSDLGCTPAHQS